MYTTVNPLYHSNGRLGSRISVQYFSAVSFHSSCLHTTNVAAQNLNGGAKSKTKIALTFKLKGSLAGFLWNM